MARRRLAGILLLLPAVVAGLTAVRLTLAAWPAAAARGEPIVTSLIGERDAEAALAKASATAPGDFSYPRDRGNRVVRDARRDGWDADLVERAWRHFGEAARRAPTDAQTRFHLSGAAWRRGDAVEADRQARAALLLAPLFRDLRDRVGAYFQARFRQTRDDVHLKTAVRALRGREEKLAAGILGDPLLTLPQVRTAFEAARIPAGRRLFHLEASGRWDWAIEIAREADRAAGDGAAREAGVRARLAAWLLSTKRREAAFVQTRRAHALDPVAVKDGILLGRALLADGRDEAARAAFDRVLANPGPDEPGRVGELCAALEADGISPAWRAAWWARVVSGGRGGDEARLARARAVVAQRKLSEAHRLLQALADSRTVGAEACFTLARAHREFGDPRVARKYARRAVDLAPRNRDYARLLRALGREEGR